MYVSVLLVDTGENPDRPRPGRLWLRNRYHVHQRLAMAFPSSALRGRDPLFLQPFDEAGFVHAPRSDGGGFLFRVDPLPAGRAAVVVQSAVEPDWQYAFKNAMHLLATPPTTSPYCPAFTSGAGLRFRLEANPTRRIRDQGRGPESLDRTTRVPVRREALGEWLAHKGEAAGFEMERDSWAVHTGYAYFAKTEQQRCRLFLARFDGLLRVTDPERFVQAIEQGIGSAKGFGFGLLSVARPA